jgi:SpoVK/Ycf46/Vps4 family AAA+-type ATPase
MIPSSACRQSPHADQPGQAGHAWRPCLNYTTPWGTIRYPSKVLAELMIRSALHRQELRRLKSGASIVLTVVVPESVQLAAIAAALESLAHATARVNTFERVEKVHDLAHLAAAAGGRPAIHVCFDTDTVSREFAAICQRTITLDFPDGHMVRKAMRKCCVGRPPAFVDDLNFSTLPFRTLCAAMPRGGRASVVAKSLAAIVAAPPNVPAERDVLPPLEDCYEFGAAQTWGLRIAQDLEDWRAGRMSAADLDTTALLVSAPGLGKTYFARVLAQHLNKPLRLLGIGEIFNNNGYLNNTLKEIRKAFAEAEKVGAVFFLDEVDSLPRRGLKDHNSSYMESLVNELLVQLDGVAQRRPGLVVIAATNRESALDPALLRPGRLSTTLRFSPPDDKGVEHILRVHLRGELAGSKLDAAVRAMAGATPAQIALWVKTARSLARRAKRGLLVSDLVTAVTAGDSRPLDTLKRVSVHEAGHALAGSLLYNGAPELLRISIVADNVSEGQTTFAARSTPALQGDIKDDIAVYLAGKAAEELVFGSASVGSGGDVGSDLWQATKMTAALHLQHGMSESLLWRGSDRSIEDAIHIDQKLRGRLENELSESYTKVKALLRDDIQALMAIASSLTRQRSITGDDVRRIIAASRKPVTQVEVRSQKIMRD